MTSFGLEVIFKVLLLYLQVHFAGACYTQNQVEKSGRRRPKLAGIQDTSLFPGVHACSSLLSLIVIHF